MAIVIHLFHVHCGLALFCSLPSASSYRMPLCPEIFKAKLLKRQRNPSGFNKGASTNNKARDYVLCSGREAGLLGEKGKCQLKERVVMHDCIWTYLMFRSEAGHKANSAHRKPIYLPVRNETISTLPAV